MSLNDLAYKGVNYLKMKCQDYYLGIIVLFVQGIEGIFVFLCFLSLTSILI